MTHLAQASSEYNYFIDLAHFLEEVIDPRSLDTVNIMPMIFDLDRYDVVCLLY